MKATSEYTAMQLAMEKSWCVYIIECSDRTFYTGITTNIAKRLKQHNGEIKGGARYTRGRGPVFLLAIKNMHNQSEALKEEIRIKKLNRKRKIIWIKENSGPTRNIKL